ncbi:hypothetical protein [Kineococcus sp. G2]|uniref:hypothetical protein n=1 Tax=Kineococcus sp. G2 TaxID=3127484 RepID=UPI00301DE40D
MQTVWSVWSENFLLLLPLVLLAPLLLGAAARWRRSRNHPHEVPSAPRRHGGRRVDSAATPGWVFGAAGVDGFIGSGGLNSFDAGGAAGGAAGGCDGGGC